MNVSYETVFFEVVIFFFTTAEVAFVTCPELWSSYVEFFTCTLV